MLDSLQVECVRSYSSDVFELVLQRGSVAFTPGDCMALYTADGRVSRPYSLASGADERVLRFVIRQMPGGVVSPYLAGLHKGDAVRVSAPFGWFRPGEHRGQRASVFVATGTGIAPFLSYCRSVSARPKPICFYGVRKRSDAVEIELLRDRSDLRLAVSREKARGVHQGRVTDLLEPFDLPQQADFYLCGLDAMIDQVTRMLEKRGIPIERIHRECFFNSDYE